MYKNKNPGFLREQSIIKCYIHAQEALWDKQEGHELLLTIWYMRADTSGEKSLEASEEKNSSCWPLSLGDVLVYLGNYLVASGTGNIVSVKQKIDLAKYLKTQEIKVPPLVKILKQKRVFQEDNNPRCISKSVVK